MVELTASGDADEVEARLREALDAHGLQLFARIDHAAGARKADVELEANVLLIFGNTRVGTPLMQADPHVGIELPLRMLIWQDADGTHVGYLDPRELADRYALGSRLRIGGTAVTVESNAWRAERMKKRGTTTVRYETRTTIDRPIGDVFARLADLDGYRTWMHRTGLFRRSGQTAAGPRGPGTAYFDATRMGTFRGQITDYQPPSRIGFRETLRWFGFDVMEARPEYLLEADGDRTIVHHIAEGELFGLMRLMRPVAALLARSERTRTLKSLRRSLESG